MSSEEIKYDYIAMDITRNCNLRCPFCFNDYSKVKGNIFMDEATFDKVLTLLPLVDDGKFLFSCLYEPTLHPNFIRFLKKIPKEHRKKVFFTTNLAKKLSNEVLEELSEIGIHHINISLDSFNPAIFEKMRRGAKFDIFIDNLERLVSIFSKHSKSPPIRYLTMVLKSNLGEIPELIKKCHAHYLATESEFRTPWAVPFNEDFLKDESLGTAELMKLEMELSQAPYKCNTYFLSHSITSGRENTFLEQINDPERKKLYFTPSSSAIRIGADGAIEFIDRGIFTDISFMKDPYNLLKDILPILQSDRARAEELQRIANSFQFSSSPAGASLPAGSEMDFLIRSAKKLKNNAFFSFVYRGFFKPILKFLVRIA